MITVVVRSLNESFQHLPTFYSIPGEDFVRNLGIADLDFATIHVYPSSWGIAASEYQWVNDNWIGSRAALAAAAGKPLMLEVRSRHAVHAGCRFDSRSSV